MTFVKPFVTQNYKIGRDITRFLAHCRAWSFGNFLQFMPKVLEEVLMGGREYKLCPQQFFARGGGGRMWWPHFAFLQNIQVFAENLQPASILNGNKRCKKKKYKEVVVTSCILCISGQFCDVAFFCVQNIDIVLKFTTCLSLTQY